MDIKIIKTQRADDELENVIGIVDINQLKNKTDYNGYLDYTCSESPSFFFIGHVVAYGSSEYINLQSSV